MKAWTNWLLATFLAYNLELGLGMKELTRNGTGEAEGKFIEFVM